MINQAWAKFFGSGWDVNNVPDKSECFEAGFNAAIEHFKNESRLVVDGAAEVGYDFSNLEQDEKSGIINLKKKTIPEIISEWNEKYEGKDE